MYYQLTITSPSLPSTLGGYTKTPNELKTNILIAYDLLEESVTITITPARNYMLALLRSYRSDKFIEADTTINKLEDNSQDASAWRTYRQALRDVTNPYKDQNGEATSDIDMIDVDNYSWPTRP